MGAYRWPTYISSVPGCVYRRDDCKLLEYHAIVESVDAVGMPTAISAQLLAEATSTTWTISAVAAKASPPALLIQ